MDNFNDVICDEVAHILSGSSTHDENWRNACEKYAGKIPSHSIEYDTLRRRFGLPVGFGANIGNVTGIQNLLTDYHLLQAYRKFSQRILGTEGRWEFSYGENKIRLFPTPKGVFPVIVRYSPSVTEFKNPHVRELAFRAILAKTKIAVGNVRRKIGNMPAPDGGTIGLDGDALVAEGKAEYDKLEQDLLLYGEPMGIFVK